MASIGTRCLVLIAMLAAGSGYAAAQSPQHPRIETNQSYVDEVARATTLAINDPMAVFSYVLGNLPERVTVYPTENYYYFHFSLNGTRYAGDLRFDAMDRDQGKLHFGFYEEMAGWTGENDNGLELILDVSRGVTVERLERLVYRVSYQGKSVVFALNDLPQVKPAVLGPDEKYIGTAFDESGIRFFFIYNSKLKVFLFLLDETVPVADGFMPAKHNDRILIGKRTGFAFYRDRRLDRKILIGVYALNSEINNYFDGPFDQLPENFIEGQTLYDFIVDVEPSMKGKIDRLGHYLTGPDRYLIHPYMMYRKQSDLDVVHRCATSKAIAAANYYGCFAFDEDNIDIDASDRRPVAMVKSSKRGAKSGGSGRQ